MLSGYRSLVRLSLTAILLAAGLLSGACSTSQSDRLAVMEILNIRTKALNTRDMALYSSILSPEYSYKGKDFRRLKDSLVNNFQICESLSFQPGEQTISFHGKYAEAVGAYRMKVLIRGKETVLDGEEHLKLAKESEGWKIIAGL